MLFLPVLYVYKFFLPELENCLQQMILLDGRINSGFSIDVRITYYIVFTPHTKAIFRKILIYSRNL